MVLITIINFCLFNSVWYRVSSSPKASSNVISYALASLPIGWVVNYMCGNLLRRYYIKKWESEDEKNDEETRGKLDDKAQFWLFLYYLSIFAYVFIGFSFCVWNMNELQSWVDNTSSNYWVATLFVGLALEYILFDPLVCIVAKSSPSILKLLHWKGMIYDQICHETYTRHLKRD